MTREEAIAEIERLLECAKKLGGPQTFVEFRPVPALEMALAALRPVSREQVERIRGEWKNFKPLIECQICGEIYNKYGENEGKPFDFCPACGTPLTDEAVDILFKRLEALNNAVD